MNRLVSLIGAPTDVGAGQRGASMGPEALGRGIRRLGKQRSQLNTAWRVGLGQ